MSNSNQPLIVAQVTVDLACNLDALTDEQRQQHGVCQQTLFAQVVAYRELPTGYQFDFPVETLELVATFVSKERLCCPFFHFSIDVLPKSEHVSLSLAGSAQVKEFLQINLADILRDVDAKNIIDG